MTFKLFNKKYLNNNFLILTKNGQDQSRTFSILDLKCAAHTTHLMCV